MQVQTMGSIDRFADLKQFYAEATATPEFRAAFGEPMALSIVAPGEPPGEHDMPTPIAAQAEGAAGAGAVQKQAVNLIFLAMRDDLLDHLRRRDADRTGQEILRHAVERVVEIDHLRLLPEAEMRVAARHDARIVIGELVGEPADLVPVHDAVPEQPVFLGRHRADALIDAALDLGLLGLEIIDDRRAAGKEIDRCDAVGPFEEIGRRRFHLAQLHRLEPQLGGALHIAHYLAQPTPVIGLAGDAFDEGDALAQLLDEKIDRLAKLRPAHILGGGLVAPDPGHRDVEDRHLLAEGPVEDVVPLLGDSVEDQSETLGRPLPHAEVCIADAESGEILPIGVVGEICVRGYQSMIGYYGLEDETRETIRADGWLRTGDMGVMDERGYLKIAGRLKDMVIRGGMNIYPREIEDVLFDHPDVCQVSVVGIADERWGEAIAAVVLPADPANPPLPEDLHAYCRGRLASHKAPANWYFVDEYPLTPSGKFRNSDCRNGLPKDVCSRSPGSASIRVTKAYKDPKATYENIVYQSTVR